MIFKNLINECGKSYQFLFNLREKKINLNQHKLMIRASAEKYRQNKVLEECGSKVRSEMEF